MNQKRLITLAPLIFGFIIIIILVFISLSRSSDSDPLCNGDQLFRDTGLNLEFTYSCEYKLTQYTNFSENVYQRGDNYYLPISNYHFSIVGKDSQLKFQVITLKTGNNIVTIDDSYEFENLEEDKVVYKKRGTNEYRYSNVAECNNKDNFCVNTLYSKSKIDLPILLTVEGKEGNIDDLKNIAEIIVEQI